MVGLVFGIGSIWFYWLYCISPILAVVFSVIGLKAFDYEVEKGKKQGQWGLGLGIFYTCFFLLKAIFLGAV